MEQWVEISEESCFDPIPPVCMVRFPDLLERIWGWERLLPEVHSSVEWHDYKTYLVQYLEKNAEKVATGKEALVAAVSGCIEAERRFIRICDRFLSYEELCLTEAIKNRARLVQSDGEYPAAAATLLAITKEAELMCEMEIHGYSTSAMRALAHQIRQAAFNLILYGGSESAAVTAAMVGLVEESKLSLEALREDGCSALMIYYDSVKIRQGFAKVLTKLGEEVACKTTGNADSLTSATKKLIGDDEKGNKKTSKSLHNVEEGGHDGTGTKAVAFSSDNGQG